MNTNPWNMFEKSTGNPNLKTPVLEVKAILENGLKRPESRTHVGILYFYIHLMEMSSTPEAARYLQTNYAALPQMLTMRITCRVILTFSSETTAALLIQTSRLRKRMTDTMPRREDATSIFFIAYTTTTLSFMPL